MEGLHSPIDNIEADWSASEKARVSRMLCCTVVGNPAKVKASLQALQARKQANEFIIVSDTFDANIRKYSLSLTVKA
ncbi:hypothetical protein [Pseudorhodobacter antarcticus]|jgi:alkanesulfonate monooxygenase SsuD/methylene tetrahydromethanopterin reductase-like flavin-dependent oxidoreductase (luciferase family)|nr:hypothetical protein [Pseudorhodobacter antarcticus]